MFDEDDTGLPFDVLLTKIDVRKAPWGLYNFYKMQVSFKIIFMLFVNLLTSI